MNGMCKAFPLIGRVLLSSIFLMSGIHKIMSWNQTAENMRSEGMMYVPLLLFLATVVELAGGLSVLLGVKARWGALLLIVFLIPVTLIFHDFWAYSGQEMQNQMQHFMKNFTIIGGLCMIVGLGAGCCSIDDRRSSAERSTGEAG